jgi:CubicO group peptidase (beta-lactamase class C family)
MNKSRRQFIQLIGTSYLLVSLEDLLPNQVNSQEKKGFNSSEIKAIDQTITAFMKQYAVPGCSMAIAKDKRLVLVKTYGYADKSTGERVSPHHRFRIASVSKPITAITIMKLMEQGKLKLNNQVFGKNGILGTEYGRIPYEADIEEITVEHLLTHTAGGWSNNFQDPMFSHPEMNQTQLISWVLDNLPLDNVPGTKYAYSNFGYCVLGRVIEKITGQSYENYVKIHILKPCGITDMQIGGDTKSQRKLKEVTYYGQGGEDPYGMKVARMDAHGGWIAKPVDLVRILVHVDSLLNSETLATMYQGSNINPNYAKGWAVNAQKNHWHNGSLPGEQAMIVNTSDRCAWAIFVNTRSQQANFSHDLDQLMWDVKSKIHTWPSFNLF